MADGWQNRIVGHAKVAPAKLVANPLNWRLHPTSQRDALGQVLDTVGWVQSVVVNKRTGFVVDGHARIELAMARGEPAVPVVYVDLSEEEERLVLATFDPIGAMAQTGAEALQSLLDSVVTDGALAEMLQAYAPVDSKALLDANRAAAAADNTLTHNVDVFFNASPALVKIATAMGFQPGIISKAVSERYLAAVEVLNLRINFVDNEFKDYKHDKHMAAVAALKPKYATTRDVMTRAQCDAAGIEFYSLDDVIGMADEVAQHAENVIIIPKYDCIDDIPDRFMLGYSIPSAYGGTPLPLERFAGRRVHLLGGNWRRQRTALGILGNAVVSLDNNHLMNCARFGQCYGPDGGQRLVTDVMPGLYGNVVAMMLSMSAIIADLSRAGCSVNGRTFASKEEREPNDYEIASDRGDGDDDDVGA